MSNLSNIGFDVATADDFFALLERVYPLCKPIKSPAGTYFVYADPSGAELYLQFNTKNECLGADPHFNGKSRQKVCLTHVVERPDGELDGAFHAWANPQTPDSPDEASYPFVFDAPGFKAIGPINFPRNVEIQLSAFARELRVYSSESAYEAAQEGPVKYATQSFIPIGLFSLSDDNAPTSPEALAVFSGVIKAVEKKRNQLTKQEFYWLLVNTLDGEVDVVADLRYFEQAPVLQGIVQGEFWLSGRLLDPPASSDKAKTSFFSRLFNS
jgi:hypothetical protein